MDNNEFAQFVAEFIRELEESIPNAYSASNSFRTLVTGEYNGDLVTMRFASDALHMSVYGPDDSYTSFGYHVKYTDPSFSPDHINFLMRSAKPSRRNPKE